MISTASVSGNRSVKFFNPSFEKLEELENGFVIVGRDSKYGLISIHGLSVIPLIYDKLTFDVSRNQYLALKKSEWRDLNLDK